MATINLDSPGASGKTEPIEILVIPGNRIVVYPNHVNVPSDYKGTIVWRLAGGSDTIFREKGVKFDETKKRYKDAKVLDPWRCQVSVDNDESGGDGKAISYCLLMFQNGQAIDHDPTVENDPPGTLG